MIITLVKADFSVNNIGTLDSFAVLTNILNATYSGPTSVTKGEAFTATIIMHDGYTIPETGISISMGGVALTDAYSVNGNVATISIATVTGVIVINMAAIESILIPVTLVTGNDYTTTHGDNTARASIQPYAIVIPEGVTISPKDGYNFAIYTNFTSANLPGAATQTGGSAWTTESYTGTGEAVGIALATEDNSDFDWSVTQYVSTYINSTDESIWMIDPNNIPEGAGTPSTDDSESGGDDTTTGTATEIDKFNTMTLTYGNPYGDATQQTNTARANSVENIYLNVGDIVGLKDNTTYKWALRRANASSYWPESVWSQLEPQAITTAGSYDFILLKASNEAFDLGGADSDLLSDYFTLTVA